MTVYNQQCLITHLKTECNQETEEEPKQVKTKREKKLPPMENSWTRQGKINFELKITCLVSLVGIKTKAIRAELQ